MSTSKECTRTFHFWTIVILFFILGACNTSTPSQTATNTPLVLSTNTYIPTQVVPPTPGPISKLTPRVQIPLDRKIIIYVDTEIWTTSHPFSSALPLLQEGNTIFGAVVWSHDGEWITYAKATLDCPAIGSIWISRYDGSDSRQISPSIEGKINQETGDCSLISAFPAGPAAFSHDDKLIVADDNAGLHFISLDTGKVVRVYPKDSLATEGIEDHKPEWLQWRGFSEVGNRALITTAASEDLAAPPILLWISLDDPDHATFLHSPPEFRFWYFPQSGPLIRHIWSADGQFLLIPDETESGDQSQLWRINVETDEWEIVRTQPISFEYDELKYSAWSPDGRWAAWWSRSYEYRTKEFDFKILFLDTTTWEIQRSVLVEDLKGGIVLGWVSLSNDEMRLVFSKGAPESEIILLDPLNDIGDQILITYEQLDLLFGDWRRVGPFQP